VRVHDDIGWSFADEDAAEVGISGFPHRQFLNHFYTGQFEGSFACGLGFNFNPQTLDMRICGTAASLAGLEQALNLGSNLLIEHAIRRILMIHSLIIGAGGIPLLYLGDEIATLNDYGFRDDPAKASDERWVHRPRFNWNRAELRADEATIEGRIFQGLARLIHVRKSTPALGDTSTLFFDTQNPHVLGLVRDRRVLMLANFSDFEQSVSRQVLAAYWSIPPQAHELISGRAVTLEASLRLPPYETLWLADSTPVDGPSR
jgi:amylosucrase